MELLHYGGPSAPEGFALDVAAGKMYWTDLGAAKISRANLDGSDVEDLIFAGLDDPAGLALDLTAGKMYWVDLGSDKIQRANLDGTGVEALVTTGLDRPRGIAIDHSGGKMYWTDWGSFLGAGTVHRANLDGSAVEKIFPIALPGNGQPTGITLDLASAKVYWTDLSGRIRRANLDGTGLETILGDDPDDWWFVENPWVIAVDVAGGKLYWGDHMLTGDHILRMNLDGESPEFLIDPAGPPAGIALDALAEKVYWTTVENRLGSDMAGPGNTGTIRRANLDGSSGERLLLGGAELRAVALDVGAGKMYWVNKWWVERANLDGSGVEKIYIAGAKALMGIALDVSAGKMYLTDESEDRIQRANLDGTGEEDLVTGIEAPHGIALDLADGQMYWTMGRHLPAAGLDGTIMRADLNGSDPEDLVTGLLYPRGIALDLTAGKMYWAGKFHGSDYEVIQRANLNGTGVEELVSADFPNGVALDVAADKIYWVDSAADKIQRANLDGTGVEDIVTDGLIEPTDIALDITSALPVELVEFAAFLDGHNVVLHWTTASEAENLGFEVQRRLETGLFEPVGFVHGNAASARRRDYDFIDRERPAGAKWADYRLRQIDFDGSSLYSEEIRVDFGLPLTVTLSDNYPNPFNPLTKISYTLPVPANVTLSVADVLGRQVRELAIGPKPAGSYQVIVDATGLHSGVYFYSLRVGDYVETKRMVLVR